MTIYRGACLCGAVRYEVQGRFERFFLCHCSRCRKDTGSAHGANLFSQSASLTWVAGEEQLRHFALSATRHARSFCGVCGSALPSVQMDGKLLVVPAGSLDDDVDLKPDAHLFAASRAAWDDGFTDVAVFDGLPK
ncbi:GFA family protein [Solimonas marina]|uniref:GFA family protein n=1 Tax=Solimonas marina TaxID=2714601 RepID=A0A969W8E6_9GAMM|nr:GFA family protein [Solimonas marina]NKF20851.1 GFA family protein [Solimonas marina]